MAMSSSTEERQAIIEELAAAIEARRELGDRMEPHVVESFMSRIEGSIERRVDERLAQHGPPRVVRPSSAIVMWTLIFGVGATAIVSDNLSDGPALVAIIVIWAAIAAINWGYARGRWH
jgi:AcrR family transcriptional regulator